MRGWGRPEAAFALTVLPFLYAPEYCFSPISLSIYLPSTHKAVPRIKPGTAGWEARMLPLCYAVPPYAPEFY